MNHETRCEQIKPALLELLMEEISPQERRHVQAHLESCRACSEEMAELRRTGSLVAQAGKFEEIPRRIRMVAEPASRWVAFWRNPARLTFASAGLLCVAMAALAMFRTTISYQNGNLQIAFGAQPAVSGVPGAAHVALSRRPLEQAQVYEMISEALAAADRNRQRELQSLLHQVSQKMEQRYRQDLTEMAGSIRYFQAAQTMLYKGQVENEQLVSTLMRQSTTPAPEQHQ